MTDYISRHANVMPRWIMYGGAWPDVVDLLQVVLREYYVSGVELDSYTFIITGIPDRDSPKTAQDRTWEPGQELTLGFAVDPSQVQDCQKDVQELYEYEINNDLMETANSEMFADCITSVQQVHWDEIHSIAILDRRGKEYEPEP